MANANENLILKNVRGQIGKQFIVKQYRGKTILTAYPNMPKDKPTALQLLYRKRFADAMKYANSIKADPVLNALYETKVKPGQKVVNYAIAEYLQIIKSKEGPKFYNVPDISREFPEGLPKECGE